MKKSAIGVLVIVLCLGGLGVGYYFINREVATVEVVTSQANYKVYENLSELEKDSDAIVLVKFTGERENYEVKQGDVLVDTLSKSTIDVKKAYVGDLKEGKTTVFEQGAIKSGKYHNVEGYKLMDEKGEYILFLRKNKDMDTYSMVGMHQGKYDLRITKKPEKYEESLEGAKKAFASSDYEYLGHDQEFDKFYRLKGEVIKKYKDK
ncbi:hypothetical protein [Tumebacillus lipolyticus]|uniref:Uncharacterized protein n=1 Tax=Tumebacillus lipolyticus TaxID=1280370 RepID=A0ABW4ZVL7_9BACL